MNRRTCARLILASSLFFRVGLKEAVEAGPGPQKGKAMNLTFSTYSTDHDQTLTAIRLISFGDEPSLVESRVAGLDQLISAHPLKQAGAKPALTWQLPQRMGLAQWDAAAANQGALAVVSTDPGGGRCPLSFGISDRSGETPLTQRYPRGVFQQPRFVKGRAETEAAISAVRPDEPPARVVVFGATTPADGAASDVSVDSGILERALIVRFGSGYLLFYKVLGTSEGKANSNQPPPVRKVKSCNETIRSGPLFYLRLDAHFQRQDKASKLEGLDVFEFDADAGQNHLVLFATTPNGFRIGRAAADGDDGLPVWSWRDTDRPEPLESPTVLLKESRVYLAAIESPASPPSKILTLEDGF